MTAAVWKLSSRQRALGRSRQNGYTHAHTHVGYTHTQVITLTPVVSEFSTNAVVYKGLVLTLGYNES